jgi:plasmid stabilization system protein ParE
MSRRYIFSTEARIEYFNAIAWYEDCSPGLGQEFSKAIDTLLQRIVANPEHFPKSFHIARKAKLKRFTPYSLFFKAEGNEVYVFAVFHGARDPEDLQRRI